MTHKPKRLEDAPDEPQQSPLTKEQREVAGVAALEAFSIQTHAETQEFLRKQHAAKFGPPADNKPAQQDAPSQASPPTPPDDPANIGVVYTNSRLDNKRVRLAVEATLSPLSMDSLLYEGSITQVVPLFKNTVMVTFRSLTGFLSGRVERYVSGKANAANKAGSEWSMFDYQRMLTLARLSVQISEIQTSVPSLLSNWQDAVDEGGGLSTGALDHNMAILESPRLSEHLVSFLLCNRRWFDDRVQTLMVGDPDFL